ncbi:hypothetical protein BJ742DRAFT_305426 [Cladochytrium replicatum]|nr:hypothetical protein BJ742DRAFT_305426 [Cladochytrium replicatum]
MSISKAGALLTGNGGDASPRISVQPKIRMSPASVALLAESVSSSVAAQFDPTFKRPTLSPLFKRPKIPKSSSAEQKKRGVATKRSKEILEMLEKVVEEEMQAAEAEALKKQLPRNTFLPLTDRSLRKSGMMYRDIKNLDIPMVIDRLNKVRRRKEELLMEYERRIEDVKKRMEERAKEKQRQLNALARGKSAQSAVMEGSFTAATLGGGHARSITAPDKLPSVAVPHPVKDDRQEGIRANKLLANLVEEMRASAVSPPLMQRLKVPKTSEPRSLRNSRAPSSVRKPASRR